MTQSGSEDRSEVANSKPHKLFVTGLDGKSQLSALEAELRKKFSKFGQLVSVVVKKSYNHEYSYAFIDFKENIDATPAMKQQNNSSILNSKITVTIQDNSRRKKGVNNTCYSCGKPGHFARDCNNTKEKSEERSPSRNRSRDRKKKKRKHSSDYSRSRSHSQRKKCKEKLRVNDRKKETFQITGQKAFQEQEKQKIKKKEPILFRLNDLFKHKKTALNSQYFNEINLIIIKIFSHFQAMSLKSKLFVQNNSLEFIGQKIQGEYLIRNKKQQVKKIQKWQVQIFCRYYQQSDSQ